MTEIKVGHRVRVAADAAPADSDPGMTGTVVHTDQRTAWVRMDQRTRYRYVPIIFRMPDGRALSSAQDENHCDSLSLRELELIPFPSFSRVRVDAPGTPLHGLRGITLDDDEAPWVRFDTAIPNSADYLPSHLSMPDGRRLDQRDLRRCTTMDFVELVLDGSEPPPADEPEPACAPELKTFTPGTRVRRTNNGEDSFEGMTGTVFKTGVNPDNYWVRFDQPTMYAYVPSGAPAEDRWRYDVVNERYLEAI